MRWWSCTTYNTLRLHPAFAAAAEDDDDASKRLGGRMPPTASQSLRVLGQVLRPRIWRQAWFQLSAVLESASRGL